MSNILHSQERVGVLAHVSDNLRRLRAAAGLSQTALATASGISRRMIIAVESGDANISLSSLDKLAGALGVGFVDLVRDPTGASLNEINVVTWKGSNADSSSVLLGSSPASKEAQMWSWSIGAGDRYDAERDPEGWHEMVFVTEGVLTLVLSGDEREFHPGMFTIYSSAQEYSYVNNGTDLLKFVRNVVS